MTQVINLFGGPGCGKSTTATGLFHLLKSDGIECEYVSEYAKDITWEGAQALLDNQIHVFAEQFRRQFRLLDKVDYIVTDSPLLLSKVYLDLYVQRSDCKFPMALCAAADRLFSEAFDMFDNVNVILKRVKPYSTVGRNQTEEQAKALDEQISLAVRGSAPVHFIIPGNREAAGEIKELLIPATL